MGSEGRIGLLVTGLGIAALVAAIVAVGAQLATRTVTAQIICQYRVSQQIDYGERMDGYACVDVYGNFTWQGWGHTIMFIGSGPPGTGTPAYQYQVSVYNGGDDRCYPDPWTARFSATSTYYNNYWSGNSTAVGAYYNCPPSKPHEYRHFTSHWRYKYQNAGHWYISGGWWYLQ
jgi:hypothetical protein